MQVFTLTEDQQKRISALKAAVKSASEPYNAAQKAYREFITLITGGSAFQRAQVSDDGKSLVTQ